MTDAATGELLADHLWFKAGKWSRSLTAGDEFEFTARATAYIKGYQGGREDVYDAPISQDWRLERPTKVVKLGRHQAIEGADNPR